MKQNIIDRINHLANEKEPFLFVINYAGSEAYIQKLSEIAIDECLYDFEGITKCKTAVTLFGYQTSDVESVCAKF